MNANRKPTVRPEVLVVDDEDFVRESLIDLLGTEGIATRGASSAAEALLAIEGREPATIVTDLRMQGGSGLDLVAETRRRGIAVPVIVLTGVGTISEAVEAMRLGAFDFIQKPVHPDQFTHLVRRALEHARLTAEVGTLRSEVRRLGGPTEIVGESRSIQRVREMIAQVAMTDAPVLVTGESGTGKELVAHAIHEQSARAGRSFIRVNCAAIPESLFESELFGHKKGSFTGATADRKGRFAEADGGTMVRDEIGTLRAEMQAKLLRVLECGEFQVVGESAVRSADVRIITSTNERLEERVRDDSFRLDLLYRLNVFPIELPPLRERKEDIALLAERFLGSMRWGLGGAAPAERLSPAALEALAAYDWPGNVRELRNVLERACIIAPPGPFAVDLLKSLLALAPRQDGVGAAPASLNLRERGEQLERDLVRKALERSGGRKSDAAHLLGVDPKNLGYYLRKHGLTETASQEPAGS